jgi:hypothetical protein
MSYLINDDLIWLSIPKCASISIEFALMNSKLNIKEHSDIKKIEGKTANGTDGIPLEDFIGHIHVKKSKLFKEFGIKETICIKRDWFDRWLSALQFFFDISVDLHQNEPIIPFQEIDNEFIYKHFGKEFSDKLYSDDYDECVKIYKGLFKKINVQLDGTLSIFLSQNYWKENENCTYEFDIKEIDKFVEFFEKRYGEKLIIEKYNQNKKNQSKIVKNNELKEFIWKNYEERFVKKNNII